MANTDNTKVDALDSLDYPVLFTDRITNVAFGPLVTKLVLSNEVANEIYKPHTILTIPTPALLDAINFISETMTTNDALKAQLIKRLDDVKAFIESNGNPTK